MRRLDGNSLADTRAPRENQPKLPSQFSFETDDASTAIQTPRSFFLPLRYESRYQYPLIVWLHSDGHNERQVEQVMPHVSLQNFVSVGLRGVRAADSMGHGFDWPQTSAGVHAAARRINSAIDEAKSRFAIHADRIVLAGHGSGGMMAMRLGLQSPEQFAGIISVGGGMPRAGRLFSDFEVLRQRKLPILWQLATQKPGFDGDLLMDDLRQLMLTGSQVEVRQYLDDDEMNTVTLKDINQWVMERIVLGSTAEPESKPPTTPAFFSAN